MSEEFLGQSESDGPQSKRKKILIGSTAGLLLLVFIGVFVFIGSEKNNSSTKVFSPKGKLVIAAQFDSVGYFQDGMVTYSTRPSDLPLFSGGRNGAPLQFDQSTDLNGYISSTGKIFPPIYALAGDFNEGYAASAINKVNSGKIDKNALWGLIDKNMNWVIAPTYTSLGGYSQGLVSFENTDKKMGFLNIRNQIVIKPQWDFTGDFNAGRAQVCINSPKRKCGFIDLNGNTIVPLIYDSVEGFSDGLARVCNGSEAKMLCGMVDLSGKIRWPLNIPSHTEDFGFWFNDLSSFSNGVALVGGGYSKDGVESWGVIDKNFKTAINGILNKEMATTENSAQTAVGRNDPWDFDTNVQWEVLGETKDRQGRAAIMDKKGHIIAYSTYDEVHQFQEGLSPIKVNGKWGFINEQNKVVVKPQYQYVRWYSQGFAAVQINNKWGFIN